MDTHLSRRSLLKNSAVIGVGSLLGVPALARLASGASGATAVPDLAVVKGGDYFKSTVAAVDRLGGMGHVIPKGAKVGWGTLHPDTPDSIFPGRELPNSTLDRSLSAC